MGRPVLIDTNVVIDLFYRRMPRPGGAYVSELINSGDFYLSAINYIELMGYPNDDEQQQYLEGVVNNATILPISQIVVEKTIELKRIKRTKTPDAIVAATALVYDLRLITRNTKDFGHLDLQLIDPHQL